MDSPFDAPLPALRDDLKLSESATSTNGEPSWVIQDTVINRFYQIGWLEFECLLRWGGTARQISSEIAEQTPLNPEPEQVLEFRQFLEGHQLLRPTTAAVDRLQKRSEGNAWLSWKWWLHHYLFFRIPLLHPQDALRALAQKLNWLFTPAAVVCIIVLSLIGIVLVMHQWDTFTHDVVNSFSMEGALGFALALIVGKTLHELGHALVATRMGLNVAHMGIAFVVMWPMLYTDTGESWKLRNPRQRLAISSAGIMTELTLAGLATLGWALCEPGALRNALLYLATTNWLLSLALNASPFMRFDGYFILCDLLDFPNLHERSSAQARVFLRRFILGFKEDWPEPFSPSRRRLLIWFAFGTWIYRLALFLGIAIAVYLLFFKVLGIALFIVELAWFIFMPIWREMSYWWKNRQSIRSDRRRWMLAVLLGLLILLALPWSWQIHAPGVARAEQQLTVYSPFPARLTGVHAKGPVAAGETLATLEQPDINSKLAQSESSMRSYQDRLIGLQAVLDGLTEQMATRQRVMVEYEQAKSARSEIARLNLQAPFKGEWRDIDDNWRPGQWLGSKEAIGVLIDPSSWQVDAYVAQDQVAKLSPGNSVRFYPKGQFEAIEGKVVSISTTKSNYLTHPVLASRYGGPLETAENEQNLAPKSSVFHVVITLERPPQGLQETLGDAQIKGDKRSLLGDALTHLLAVLVRESGF